MWNWLADNSEALNVVSSFLMLVIWALYFQLLLGTYRHQNKPKILINHAGGRTLESRCIITNMSAEKIYLESLLLTLYGPDRHHTFLMTELGNPSPKGSTSQRWFQGPLASGELADMGTYRSLLDDVTRAVSLKQGGDSTPEDFTSFTVTVIATYTAEDRLVGAERSFDLDDERKRLFPKEYSAEQIRSGRRRRALERFMLDKARAGMD